MSHAFRLALFIAVAASSAGCKRNPMAQSYQLDRLRVLAVRGTPAEPQPGETVSFESYVYLPEGELDLTVWFACLPEGATDFGCELDSEALDGLEDLDPESMTPEEQAELFAALLEAGLIGIEPYLPPTWEAPADALEGLDDVAQREGVSALVTVQAIPPDAEEADDIELAYKRIPISLATTPNHNPDLAGLLIDGEAVDLDQPVELARGREYEIEPVLSDDAIEAYSYLTEDSVEEEREEEPYFSWYIEDGSLDQSVTLYPTSSAAWTTPDEAFEGELRVVVRDRRGGMGWATLRVVVP